MKATSTGALPITKPFRESSGISFSWRRGDILQPLDYWSADGWFSNSPPWREYYRGYTRLPLPFISIRIGRWGFYAGAKGFGVDKEDYLRWVPAREVFDGSTAIMLSIRMTTNLGEEQ